MKKAFIFDFDDTLATTECMVEVWSTQWPGVVCELTPSEYNTYRLGDDEVFLYSQFEDLINPVPTWLLPLAQEVSNEDHAVYILTARGRAAGSAIKQFLSNNAIDAEVVCVGESDNIELAKGEFVHGLLDNFDKVYFYDDHSGNIDAMPVSDKLRKYLV